MPSYIVIADPASMRWEHYSRDLLKFWEGRGVTPDVQVIHWEDVIQRDGDIADLLPEEETYLRIESPARDFELIRMLLKAGDRSLRVPERDWNPPREGWVASPKRMYQGLSHVLHGLNAVLAETDRVTCLQSIPDILTMFDKRETHQLLAQHELPRPASLIPDVPTAEALFNTLDDRGWNDVFLKVAYGSCASGIIRLMPARGQKYGYTTLTMINHEFFNSYEIGTWGERYLNEFVTFVLLEDAIAEQTIDKARVHGQNFDVRVVVVHGEVAGCVARVSSNIMTNLHLGGRRGNLDAVLRVIPKRNWLDGISAAVEAATLFDVPAVGVDLMFDRQRNDPYIVEVNAFGDFLPNWRNDSGQTIHEQEIEATARKLGWID